MGRAPKKLRKKEDNPIFLILRNTFLHVKYFENLYVQYNIVEFFFFNPSLKAKIGTPY